MDLISAQFGERWSFDLSFLSSWMFSNKALLITILSSIFAKVFFFYSTIWADVSVFLSPLSLYLFGSGIFFSLSSYPYLVQIFLNYQFQICYYCARRL